MRSNLILYLLQYETKPGAFSDEGERITQKRRVYANSYGISLDSSIRARREGLRIAGRAEIYTFEYRNEEDVEISGKVYRILHTKTRGDKTIITYGEAIGDGN